MSQIAPMLRADEGFSATPFWDTEGYPTIGTGLRIGPKGAPLSNYSFIISQPVADAWMQDVANGYRVKLAANSLISPAWQACDEVRRDVLLNMSYQMGSTGLAGFPKALALIAAKNFKAASVEMLNSRWRQQTPERAARLANVMLNGNYSAYKAWFTV